MSNESYLPGGITRRDALRLGLATGAAATLATAGGLDALAAPPTQLNEATVAGLQAAMKSGDLSSRRLVDFSMLSRQCRCMGVSSPICGLRISAR